MALFSLSIRPTMLARFCFFMAALIVISLAIPAVQTRAADPVLMLIDINPRAGGNSNPSSMVVLNGVTYFAANDGFNGTELWRSDGTAAGTYMLKDLYPGSTTTGTTSTSNGVTSTAITTTPNSSNPANLTVMGTALYFSAEDTNGRELWKTNGTAAGTIMVKNIHPGDTNTNNTTTSSDGVVTQYSSITIKHSSPNSLVVMGTTLFFTAFNPSYGIELWKSDGTEAGTSMVKDATPGTGSTSINYLTPVGTRLYFTGSSASANWELWISDGTALGTMMLKDINPGAGQSYPWPVTAFNGLVYFAADNGTYGRELWRSDGTPAGTFMLKDINPGTATTSSNPEAMVVFNNKLFFTATSSLGAELWVSDGTALGTMLFKDISPGTNPANGFPYSGRPTSPIAVGTTLFFRADTPSTGIEMWKSDGTLAGTIMIKDIYPGTQGIGVGPNIRHGSSIYFVGNDGSTGSELWRSDGTALGTVQVADIFPGINGCCANSSSPASITSAGSIVLFSATNGTQGRELWRTP